MISVGGVPHTVRDLRAVSLGRRRIEFEDGNVYVLGPGLRIEVHRVAVLPAGTTVPWSTRLGPIPPMR